MESFLYVDLCLGLYELQCFENITTRIWYNYGSTLDECLSIVHECVDEFLILCLQCYITLLVFLEIYEIYSSSCILVLGYYIAIYSSIYRWIIISFIGCLHRYLCSIGCSICLTDDALEIINLFIDHSETLEGTIVVALEEWYVFIQSISSIDSTIEERDDVSREDIRVARYGEHISSDEFLLTSIGTREYFRYRYSIWGETHSDVFELTLFLTYWYTHGSGNIPHIGNTRLLERDIIGTSTCLESEHRPYVSPWEMEN